jgi:hypothetical protein
MYRHLAADSSVSLFDGRERGAVDMVAALDYAALDQRRRYERLGHEVAIDVSLAA